ncbi:Putative surface protein SA2285 precursor [Anaerococcus prevotii]|uniref:G5 domain protein n=1 Tax=Anaerococcus prevotii (strain ATCC 9321 / DSM 20548 / JCM 6508 / NCTC 11806 / PC1) TaxID=525919 RepID=C7RD82_ANAPD|nr:G5 domain-containing protein [Anaerococcus prevotii]ACV29145.1 G5 domain protein [Anaerococcus prevotii DSM 20548]SUU94819.1 Putative surface protein SA2285 precursor [Anaerococcus prevotii]
MNHKKNKFVIPLSNESIKKALLGASIIVGGFGLLGNSNTVYADTNTPQTEIVNDNQSQDGNLDSASKEDENTHSESAGDNKETKGDYKEEAQEEEDKKEEGKQTPLINDANGEQAKPEFGQDRTPTAQGAGETETKKDIHNQSADDPNYGEDEGKIKDYDGSERYKQTDLQPGDPNQTQYKTDEKKVKDGFKFEFKNPSSTSPSKTEYGYQITIDKKTGQRTYTKVYVTDSGNLPVDTGEKPMIGQGDKLTPESPGITYKPDENTEITAARTQRNLNYEASEETLKHINSKDNPSTSFGFKDNYTQDNPKVKFFGAQGFALGYKVNPWPNENDKLEQLKLNGKYDKKVFVQGQDIDTGIKVDNIDESAKERLVGQVYNPITGKIVPGASAYIKNGTIHIQMPEGALKKDKSGKTVINEDSIFNTPDYKALQNLDVKFFARPRTADEFKKIAETPDEFGEKGTYVGTGAGSATINHNGKDVTIDKQGIDRYDHYNLIGNFKLNLDDTRYYDQRFEDGNGDDTSKVTSSAVKPGKPFKVGIVEPENPGETDKSAEEMNEAENKGEASGRLIMDFINKANEGKAPEDQWKVDLKDGDISNFTITPPKSAKAGDFIAIPIEYTYTNGSKDVHWFHFVVQESTYIRPEYDAQVNFPVNEQTSEAKVAQDTKRISPDHYTLPDTLETDEAGNKLATDDKGNKWTVKVDEKTGKVSAKPVDPTAFDGGEKLTVPVVAHYVDEQKPREDVTEEVNAYFVIEEKANMTPRYNAKAGKEGDTLSSDVILNEEDRYNRRPGKFTLDSKTYTDDKGNTWNVSIDETTGKVTATVPNAEEGKSIDGALLNVPVTAHYYEEDAEGNKVEAGTKTTEVQFVAYGTNGKVEKTLEIPFETKVEKDPTLKKGEIKVITEGKKGSKKVTYTIKDSKIDDTKTKEEVIEKAEDRVIHVGEGVNDGTHKIEEKVEIGFETEIQFDDSLAPGETKEVQKGEAGEKKRDITLTIEDGNVTKTETGEFTETKAPTKRIIKVGRNTEGKVEHKEELPFKYKVEEVDDLKKGEYRIAKPGKVGTKTTTWTIKNSKVDGEPTVTEDPAEDALIQVGKGTNDGTHEVKEKKNIDYKTIIEYDENLDAGQQEVVKEGNPGEQERTNTLVIKDGQVTETKEGEFKTTKEATDRVVKIGTKPVTKVVEKPFNTEYVYDENLESGKTEEVTPGKNGKVTITTSYDKDQKKVVTSEKEEKGQNRVVKIGGKTNGTEKVKEEIPFEVEVRKDPSLKKGEWKYAKDDEGNELKGEKGEQERTLTIENSKVINTSEPTVTKKAKNAVILVGEGTNDGTHKIVEKKELPFETRYEYDDSLEPGEEKVVTPGSPGEQERTNTLVIKDGKVVETKEGEFKTTKKPQERLIKIGRKPSEGETTKTIEREIPYETKVIYDENLEAGFQKIENEGKPGKEEVTITQKIKDSKPVGEATETTKTITEKEDRVVRIGLKPVEKIVELGNDTEYRHNPELKAGEEKVIEEGSKGSVKYTTTFNKETGKLEVTEERVEPKNKVVEYGSKTDGEFTYESEKAYDIIIRENPNLEAGKTNVIQEGKPGKTETTVKIENSKEVDRTTKTITEKQDKIIEIGTKNVCEIPPVDSDPSKPGEKEDPSKPGEKEDPSKPGEKEDPSKPGEKEDPSKPGEKEDPSKPGEKEDPSKPGEKEDPSKPGEKEDPSKPGEKEDPSKPGEKEDPSKPGEKEEPGKPGETPEQPGKPGDPEIPGENTEKPEDPTDPKPNKPGKPNEPGNPEKPEDPKPEKPESPDKTETPDKSKNPKKDEGVRIDFASKKSEKAKEAQKDNKSNRAPKTGVSGTSGVLVSLFGAASALFATKKKKKK